MLEAIYGLPQQQDEPAFGEDAWAVLHKTVRNIDEGKVKDCKEDVDTLLVFAGLYSAVLTAFLIESYKNLEEDPQQIMVQLLRQISSQTSSYTMNAGFLNSTVQPLSTQLAFQPLVSDVRVNVCWFASLILSLATASFGMLVKQWLREYLAIDRTVPQECIRIRHFRCRGLEEWKLFEIAAALPLILQLSLTLFFVGLCFFTAEVHPTVRATSLCLVSGWAILFAFALLAPLLSARCPYKTTFLKASFRHIRPLLRAQAGLMGRLLLHLSLRIAHPLRYRISSVIRWMGHGVSNGLHHVMVTTTCVRRGAPRESAPKEESGSSDQLATTPDILIVNAELITLLILTQYAPEEGTTLLEEDEAQHADQSDLAIFNDVDSILLDDHLLTLMRAVLRKSPPSVSKVLKFIATAIQYRLQVDVQEVTVESLKAGSFSGLDVLLPSTRRTLVNILTDALCHGLMITTVDLWYLYPATSEYLDHILLLIIALVPPHSPMPEATASLFCQLLRPSLDGSYRGCALLSDRVLTTAMGYRTTDDWQSHVLTLIADILRTLDPRILKDIIHWTYIDENDVTYESNTYGRILDGSKPGGRADTNSNSRITPAILIDLIQLAAVTLHSIATSDEQSHEIGGPEHLLLESKQLLEFIVQAVPIIKEFLPSIDLSLPHISCGIGLDELFMHLLLSPTLVLPLLQCFATQPRFLSSAEAQQLLFQPLLDIERTHSLTPEVEITVLSAFAEFFDSRRRLASELDLASTLQLCLLVISFPTVASQNIRRIWPQMLRNAVECIRRARSLPQPPDAALDSEQDDPGQIARSILELLDADSEDNMKPYRIGRPAGDMHSFDDEHEDSRYSRWLVQFNVADSYYPDELFDVLRETAHSTTDILGRTFWRVRRLEDLERQNLTIASNMGAEVSDPSTRIFEVEHQSQTEQDDV